MVSSIARHIVATFLSAITATQTPPVAVNALREAK
jgi:hypothetical protein